jgi:hypothetical protein
MRTYPWIRAFFLLLATLALSTAAFAQVGVSISVGFPPPELPVYQQPLCPGENYIWTPGYWDWDGEDYYWVPGTWVLAPEPGYLWTPPYWDWDGDGYAFHQGYWAPEVGFYGGIDYGYGYYGHGYEGGRWEHDHFYYNRAVNHIDTNEIHDVYDQRVTQRSEPRVSYHGGQGGINDRPTSQEEAAMRARHIPPVATQTQHIQQARSNPQFRASENHGKPPIAATAKPTDFHQGAVPPTSAARYNPPARVANNPARAAVHPNDLAPHQRPNTPPNANTNTNAKANGNQRYQQQQEEMYNRQQQEHQKLQQQQEQEHQRATQQHATQEQQRQMEQRHQQQTQQMEQRHVQEQQHAQQQHQAPPPSHQPPPSQPHEAPKKP